MHHFLLVVNEIHISQKHRWSNYFIASKINSCKFEISALIPRFNTGVSVAIIPASTPRKEKTHLVSDNDQPLRPPFFRP